MRTLRQDQRFCPACLDRIVTGRMTRDRREAKTRLVFECRCGRSWSEDLVSVVATTSNGNGNGNGNGNHHHATCPQCGHQFDSAANANGAKKRGTHA